MSWSPPGPEVMDLLDLLCIDARDGKASVGLVRVQTFVLEQGERFPDRIRDVPKTLAHSS
jgi:hypothetical protein